MGRLGHVFAEIAVLFTLAAIMLLTYAFFAFNSIENEPEQSCIYKRLKMDYTVGLNKIYAQEEIEKAESSPGFQREYNLAYLGLVGNSFRQSDVQRAIEFEYDPNEYQQA